MFGSSKQDMDLQNSESVMGQAMDQQDNQIPLWEIQTIIQQIILKVIFPRNNILDIGRQTQPSTTSRKCKDLQIPQMSSLELQSHSRDGTGLLQWKYKPASLTPTRNQTNPEIWILAENKVKHFQPEQGRASSSVAPETPYFTACQIPEPQLKAVGKSWTRVLHSPLSCTGCDLYSNFFLKFSKILSWWIEVSLEQTFYKENDTFLRVSIFHWNPVLFLFCFVLIIK